MEMDNDTLLIGIGCNIIEAPPVEATGIDGGRPATCIIEHLVNAENKSIEDRKLDAQENLSKQIANHIFSNIISWIASDDSVTSVTTEYMRYVAIIEYFVIFMTVVLTSLFHQKICGHESAVTSTRRTF